MNLVTISHNDYKILKEVYAVANEKIKAKLIDLSVWQMADMVESEVKMEDISKCCIKHKRIALLGDVVYIKSGSPYIGDEYIGRCYRVHTRFTDEIGISHSAIRAVDTYSNQGNEYLVLLDDEQYLVLE